MALELVYVHFPKASGTSIVESLALHYRRALAIDNTCMPPYDRQRPSPAVPPGIRAIHGHFHASRYAEHPGAFRFTFLREPVDNLLSIYYYWKNCERHGYPPHERFLRESPSVFEFAQWPVMKGWASRWYFGGVDMERFNFVGFYERRDSDISKLSRLLNIDIRTDIHLLSTSNGAAERRAILADQSAVAQLRDHLREEVAFYEQMRERWD